MTCKKVLLCGVLISGLACVGAVAAAETVPGAAVEPEKVKKMGGASGTPVNSAISGGAIVPKGMLSSALNFSYRDKDDIVDNNGNGARTSENELFLLKLRYSPTDRFEIAFVPGYVNIDRDAFGPNGADSIDGPTDFALAGSYAFFSQRLGDPLSAAVILGVNMPTGQEGVEHPSGSDVWSFNGKIGITKIWHPNHRIDWDLGIVQPTETGNQGFKKDTVWSTTGSYHYVFNPRFDLGLEFTVENTSDWERYGADLNNGGIEVYAGPTANYVIPKWNMWLGAGLFFPVVREYDIPTATDDIRVEVKLGKVWNW